MSSKKVSVLFVCMGNICRSPTGEGVFQAYVSEQGYSEKFYIDSAGTIAYHQGEPADQRMLQAARNRGYELHSLARKVIPQDLEEFDLIIAMDSDNFMDLQAMTSSEKDKIVMFGSFIDGYDNETAPSVPDPYYGGAQGFEDVLDLIESACPNLLQNCLEILEKKD